MAESPQVASHNRALRLGYRLRWLYLALVVFGAIVWWGMWPGQALWAVFEKPGYYSNNPILYLMDVIAFFWLGGGGDGWFSDHAGMDEVWGWPRIRYWWYYNVGAIQQCLWWVAGAIGLPVALIGGVLGFVGVRPNLSKSLPAKRRPSWSALAFATLAGALVLSGLAMVSLHLTGWLEVWDEAWENAVVRGFTTRLTPGLMAWPPHMVWLLIVSVLPVIVALWFLVIRREIYWQLERMTRMVGLASFGLFVFSLLAAVSDVGRGGGYWGMRLNVWPTVWFSASTALLWAASCRVWLLFRLVKYEKQRMAMMTESPVCFACEYDLSGSLRGGVRRCPECGVAVPGEVVERFGAAVVPGNGVVETEEASVGE